MVFNSFNFVIFFLAVSLILWAERSFFRSLKLRNIILLTAGYVFYGWFNPGFLAILLLVTAINYATGSLLLNPKHRQRKAILACGVIMSLLPLLFYKYAIFFLENLGWLLRLEWQIEVLDGLMLPVGISFFTFQALSYSIDVYRRKITERYAPVDFALFVAFFPTLLSGPIEKARNLLPQIARYTTPRPADFMQGAILFTWGLFKKIVIADRLAVYVDWAYGSSQYVSGSTLAVAAVFYSIQIYCDFSGYSDMALGIAKALGFDITQNFRHPYFASTFKEFWRRWHISLTSWFTEYVYFSLGGSRVRLKARWIFNISTIFLLSGIWHGAAWNFLIWGALHALYYLAEYFCGLQRPERTPGRLLSAASALIVFAAVTIAWIFFRVEEFPAACAIVAKIFTDWSIAFSMGASTFSFAASMLMLAIFVGYEILAYRRRLVFEASDYEDKLTLNLLSVVPLILLIAMFGQASDNFVYFQF